MGWAKAISISRRCLMSWGNGITAAGSSWRMSCRRGWASRWRARGGTGRTCRRWGSDVVRNVRIGLIGAGVMGRIHARGLSRDVNGSELIAVADLDREKAERCAEEFGATDVHGDDASLLADRSIDAVLICTPGNTHADLIEAAAQAGKKGFFEKAIEWGPSAADKALASGGGPGGKVQMRF